MKKKILITGSNGLLGQKLVHLLLKEPGTEVIATSRGPNKLTDIFPDLYFVTLDITNLVQVKEVLIAEKPTHIIHTAALTNVDACEVNKELCWELNVTGTQNLVNACAALQIHFLHLSTDFIFDGEAGPYTEEAEGKPLSFYGESKLAAEAVVKASSIKWAIIRTVLVYGIVYDYGRSNIVLWVKNNLEAGKNIRVVNDQIRTPTLAEDLAMGCWLVVKQEAEGVFHIAGKEILTPYQMALQVADFFKLNKNLISETNAASFMETAKRPLQTGFIITKAETRLGYKPHSFKEGIALVAEQIK